MKMKMKRLFLPCLSLLCTAGLLVGCQGLGGNKTTDNNTQSGPSVSADWSAGFRVGPLQEGESLYAIQYLNLEHSEQEGANSYSIPLFRVNEEGFFVFRGCSTDEGYRRFIEMHSPEQEQLQQYTEIQPGTWQLSDATVESFDTTEDGFVFLVGADYTTDSDGNRVPDSFRLVYTDRQGALISQMNLTVMLKEQNLFQEITISENNLYRDREGYLYLMTSGNRMLLVLNPEGELVTQYTCRENSNSVIETPFKDDSGRLIIPVSLEEEKLKRLYGRMEKDLKELAALEEQNMCRWLGMSGSSLYYASNSYNKSSLIRWNVETGLREEVLDLKLLGITDSQRIYVMLKAERDVRLRVYSSQEDYVVTLSDQEPEYSNPMRLALISSDNDGKFLSSSLAGFSRKNPLDMINLERDREDNYAFRDRIMAEIMAGRGPDILCVSPEDMEILAEKGALLPIDQLISDETLKVLLPGVVQMGDWEGKLMGIAPEVISETLFTSNSIWAEDSWTLEDVLTLAEEREGLEGILTYGVSDMPAYNVLYDLVGRNLENTRFLDMEKGQSCFEQENFMRVLELVKRFDQKGSSTDVNGTKRVTTGAYLAEEVQAWDPGTFFSESAFMDEEGHNVGFPSESGGGSYIGRRGLLVVNAQAENLETISSFLEYLLSFENQRTLTFHGTLSVRSDMVDRSVTYQDAIDRYVWEMPDGLFILESRADGTTFTKEFKDYLQSCVPFQDHNDIFDIVWDEAQSYFAGDKDALTVTRTIDNRVQLYLDERK